MAFDEYDYLEEAIDRNRTKKDHNEESSAKRIRLSEDGSADKSGDSATKHRHRSRDEERDSNSRSERRKFSDRDADQGEKSEKYENRSKDGRNERYERSRDREKEHLKDRERDSKDREKERHRNREDREKERYKDREREDLGREKERHRDREKEYSKDRPKERDEERSRDREREKERSRDRERERERSRERDREKEKPRDRERERSRGRSVDKDYDRARSAERDRENPGFRRARSKEAVSAEPEADPERDQRTVFAYQICLRADEYDVYNFFSQAGKVRDVRLIMDRNTGRSKGVGYIEFYDANSVATAIGLSGQPLRGQPVMVKASEAEKNLVQSTTSGSRRLSVSNLHQNVTEEQLRQVFQEFGPLEQVQVYTEPRTGHCKGFGFVIFEHLEHASAAQEALNDKVELAGLAMKVSAVPDQFTMQDMGLNPGSLDVDERIGLPLSASSRALLMQKLDRSKAARDAANALAASTLGFTPIVPSITPIGQSVAPKIASQPIGTPSEYLILKNMFDPTAENKPDFDVEIKEEVFEECSKFGAIKHIYVDKHSLGHVYLHFETINAAVNAQRALHGRWFAGKVVTATYMTQNSYEYRFRKNK